MPVREQDHRVVARPMAALLGGAEECCDFVAGEIIAQTRFAGHASNLARPPSPSSPRERSTRVDARRLTARPTRPHRPAPLPEGRFSGGELATERPKRCQSPEASSRPAGDRSAEGALAGQQECVQRGDALLHRLVAVSITRCAPGHGSYVRAWTSSQPGSLRPGISETRVVTRRRCSPTSEQITSTSMTAAAARSPTSRHAARVLVSALTHRPPPSGRGQGCPRRRHSPRRSRQRRAHRNHRGAAERLLDGVDAHVHGIEGSCQTSCQ